MMSLEAHRSFEKQFSQSQMSGTLSPGWGASWGVGTGYHLKSWRFGATVNWIYEDPIEIRGSFSSVGALERYATSTFSVSYFPNDDWSGAVSYSDQTLIGSPLNTSLGKGFALNLQRRWSR